MSSKSVEEAKHFKYQILGDTWNIYKVNPEDGVIMSENNAAEVHYDAKEIFFKETDIDTIIHEIGHVYFKCTYVRHTSICVSDFEEIAVALIAHRGRQIIQQSDEIFLKLKELE